MRAWGRCAGAVRWSRRSAACSSGRPPESAGVAGKSFLPVYDAEYADKLGLRAETFRKAFEILEATEKSRYSIVETGCARKDDWFQDGQSTLLFDRFVNFWDGAVRTVDIEEKACAYLRTRVSAKVNVTCGDSVAY